MIDKLNIKAVRDPEGRIYHTTKGSVEGACGTPVRMSVSSKLKRPQIRSAVIANLDSSKQVTMDNSSCIGERGVDHTCIIFICIYTSLYTYVYILQCMFIAVLFHLLLFDLPYIYMCR